MKARKVKKVGIYVRVSTDGQNTKNQENELRAAAERHGWTVVAVYRDHGISGAKGREQRPGLDKLLQAVARKEIDMVAAWSVDRLGRSLQDLVGLLEELHAKGVDLFLHQQGLDNNGRECRAVRCRSQQERSEAIRRLTFAMSPEVHDQLRLIAFMEHATLQGLLMEGMELMVEKRRALGVLPAMPARPPVPEMAA